MTHENAATFRCPRCGGRFFGAVLAPWIDPGYQEPLTQDSAVQAAADGKFFLWGTKLNRLASLAMLPPDIDFRDVRVGDVIIDRYRCHSTVDGLLDVTAGGTRIDYGDRVHFFGAKGNACGWEGPASACLLPSQDSQ